MEFYEALKKVSENLLKDESMKKHTSFKIGGNAEYLVIPESFSEIKDVIDLCKNYGVSYTVIGNGSNILISDDGISGVIIKISSGLSSVKIDGENVFAEAGVLLSTLANKVKTERLTGLEFASGIPGTLGGALVMNAGAYGGEMKDVVKKIGYLDSDGEIKEISGKDAGFGYRKSIFNDSQKIILYAELSLKKGDIGEISDKMQELNQKRKDKQPLNFPSAGSTFKRPEGYFAAKLIEDAGLKGYTVGGAKVSEKHAGFVVNFNDATAEDVKKLMEDVKDKVFEKFGVTLEPEVKFLGE